MAPALILLFIGMWIDSNLQTSWCAVVFLILGILGGAKSAYGIAMNSLKMDERKEEDPQAVVNRYNMEHNRSSENDRKKDRN